LDSEEFASYCVKKVRQRPHCRVHKLPVIKRDLVSIVIFFPEQNVPNLLFTVSLADKYNSPDFYNEPVTRRQYKRILTPTPKFKWLSHSIRASVLDQYFRTGDSLHTDVVNVMGTEEGANHPHYAWVGYAFLTIDLQYT